MPRNGSGTYQLPAGNPVVTQTLITSNWANTTLDDLAIAITNSLAKDGQTTPTANLPMGNFRHTGVSNPTSRNQYSTLAFEQDGSSTRLTGVNGANTITGTLPGGATSLVVGQLVQLIPVSNNTSAVTLNINGIGAKPIVTDIGSALGAGNLIAGRPYILQYDGASFVMLTGGAGAVAQSAITGWDRPTPTGPYPSITIVNPTTVAIPAGKGRIIRPGTRDLSGVTEVSWAAQNVTITAVATAWSTLLGVTASGVITQFSGPINASWARDNILLGVVTHINGTIDAVSTEPAIYGDMLYASYDLITMFDNTYITGGLPYANGVSPFHVNISAGQFFSLGANSSQVDSPNILQVPNIEDVEFYPVTGTSGVGAITQNVPVTQYDPGGLGIVTTLPNTTSTAIHRLFKLGGEYLLAYGQTEYPDLATALNQLAVDDAEFVPPPKLANATFLGRIVAQKDTTNLNDTTKCRFIAGDSIGGGGSGSGGISDAPIDGRLYGRKDATWTEAVEQPRGAASTFRMIEYYTNNSLRFDEGLNADPEAGGNAGSNFELRAYSDAGALTGTAFRVNRATRETTFLANAKIELPGNPLLTIRASSNAVDEKQAQVILDTSGAMCMRVITDTFSLKGQVRVTDAGTLALDTGSQTGYFRVEPGTISADFSNPSLGVRMKFQTTTVNGITAVGAAPDGTGTTSFFSAYNSSDLANSSSIRIQADATVVGINSTNTGTGTLRDVTVQFNSIEAFRFTPTRLIADFNNATLNNRTTFRPAAAGASAVGCQPGTGGTSSNWTAWGSPTDLANTHAAQYGISATHAVINSISTGTGTVKPISLQVQGTEKVGIDASGNMVATGTITGGVGFLAGNGQYIGSVFGPASPTSILLRPNGVASSTGQMTVTASGEVQSSINFAANGAGNTWAVLHRTGATTNGGLWRGTSSMDLINNNAGFKGMHIADSNGATTFDDTVTAAGVITSTGSSAGFVFRDRTTSRNWNWYGSGDQCFLHNGSANIITGTTGGSFSAVNWVATSDANLKDITGRPEARDLAPLLWFTSYTWKPESPFGSDRGVHLGLIAQEVQQVAPEYVKDIGGVLSLDKMGLLTECVIAQAATIKKLEAKLAELEEKINGLAG